LSTVYNNMGEGNLARTHISRAYELKDRVSEPERLYITARYHSTIDGSVQKTIETYQIWIQTYPKDFVPHSNLGGAYSELGDYAKAVEEYRAAIGLAPDEMLPYSNLADMYIALNKPDEARRTLEDAIARGLDATRLRSDLYNLAFYRHDEAEMARQIDAARRFPDGFRVLTPQMNVALYSGQLARARELAAQYGSESASRTGLKGSTATLWSLVAQSAGVFGDAGAARAAVRTALGIERNLDAVLNSAFALVVIDDVAAAQKLLDEAIKQPGASNEDAQRGIALVSALIHMRQGDRGAIETIPPPRNDKDFGSIFTLGAAHLAQGNTEMAAQQFKKIVDRREPSTSLLKPLASLYYGRTLAKLRKNDESRKAYEEFFAAWKDADANLPVLVAAKREYARLKSE
jgi:Flp pilus assembly protein TadD